MSHPESYPICRSVGCRTPKQAGYADRGLCAGHEAAGLDAIRSLPADFADLLPYVWDKPKAGLGATGSVFGPSEPIYLPTDALVREIRYAAVQWAEIVRDRASLSNVRLNGYQAVETLTAHYSALIATPTWPVFTYDRLLDEMDGIDAVLWFISLHRRATGRIGLVARTTSVPGACMACGHETLRHRDSGEDVWCVSCRETFTWNEYVDSTLLIPA